MNVIDPRLGSCKPLTLYGVELSSRLLLGTARYPSPQAMSDAVKASRAGIVTVSLRREQARGNGAALLRADQGAGRARAAQHRRLPQPKEAITTAQMARELFGTDWIKLEVIGDDDTLQPDLSGWSKPPRALTKDGFKVLPYTTDDLVPPSACWRRAARC